MFFNLLYFDAHSYVKRIAWFMLDLAVLLVCRWWSLYVNSVMSSLKLKYKLLNNIYVFIFTRDFDQEKWTKNLFMNKYDVDDYSLIC